MESVHRAYGWLAQKQGKGGMALPGATVRGGELASVPGKPLVCGMARSGPQGKNAPPRQPRRDLPSVSPAPALRPRACPVV